MKKEIYTWRAFPASMIVALALFTILIAGCNKGLSTERSESVDGNGLPIVSVVSLAPTPGSVGQTLDVTVVDGDSGFDVSVRAGQDTPLMEEIFFQVVYDPKDIQAESITIDNVNNDGSSIELAIEQTPGVIEVGIVATNLAEDPVVRAGEALLSFTLVEGGSEKIVSSNADSGLTRPGNLEFDDLETGWTLSWDYTNPGDNNQDGEVGVSDLTPIAKNYGHWVKDSWADPLRHIDGDRNREINLADITPIATHYAAQVWAYQIEMSEDGIADFITVGQYLLNDFNQQAGATVRFTYEFGPQYVEGAWYRVVALDRDLAFGPPSEAISEAGRRIDPINVERGDKVIVTVNAHDLGSPISHMNSVRVQFPIGYSYVDGSTNAGSRGGANSAPDGIWGSFSSALLFPPDLMFEPTRIGDDFQAIDFNVTTLVRELEGAPVGYGDLFNFQLEGDGTTDLTLEFIVTSDDGILRTYYTDITGETVEFGNKLGFEIKEVAVQQADEGGVN